VIVTNEKIMGGEPRIAGTRIPVWCIQELIEVGDAKDAEQIQREFYPHLTLEQVQEAVDYIFNWDATGDHDTTIYG